MCQSSYLSIVHIVHLAVVGGEILLIHIRNGWISPCHNLGKVVQNNEEIRSTLAVFTMTYLYHFESERKDMFIKP